MTLQSQTEGGCEHPTANGVQRRRKEVNDMK